MSIGLVFAILAPFFYALSNVVIEHWLSKYNNLSLIIIYCLVIAGIAALTREVLKDGVAYHFPQDWDLVLLLVLGFILFAADYCFVGAYTNDMDLLTVTCLMILFPVFASILKMIGSYFIPEMELPTPNWWQISGYVLGAIAVILVAKGSIIQ